MNQQNISPTPTKTTIKEPSKFSNKTIDFYEALKEVAQGNRITKLEWNDPKYYGILKDTHVMLHKPDGKFYDWIVSDGDLAGDDFIVL